MQESKTDKVRHYVSTEDYKKALSIAKSFKLGFTKDEKETIEIAHELLSGNESFYTNLGYNKDTVVSKAINILKEKYQ
jgi:predicted ATPase